MTENEVNIFLKLKPQIKNTYDEISLLSKKNPTESLNKFKLKFINSMIIEANEILGDKYKPFPNEFEQFDADDMPNNGDVVFILSHYLTSLEKLRCDNIRNSHMNTYWVINGAISELRTDPATIR